MAKGNTPQAIRGTQSLIGAEADRFHHVVQTFDRVRRLYGFKRIEMPVFEATAVFARSLGETTDVVGKEMYSFEDRGGDSLTLRPEFTAGIARAYLTEGWQQYIPLKVATHGPAFRYERPQKGRFRQFHQLDAEIIGAAEPAADVEVIAFADQLLKELKIEGVTLKLNTLGDAESRAAWRSALYGHFFAHKEMLSEDSNRRLDTNPLRILDSKDPKDRPIADSAPQMTLSGEAETFYDRVKEGLSAAGISFEQDAHLVRGLDYYRHTAFEFVTDPFGVAADKIGTQNTVLGGGRYDGLIEALGGNYTPAVGWAAGIERLGMLCDAPYAPGSDLAIVIESDSSEIIKFGYQFAADIRNAGRSAEVFNSGPIRKRFERARRGDPRCALIVGDNMMAPEQVASIRLKSIEGFQPELENSARLVLDAVRARHNHVRVDENQFLRWGGEIELYSDFPF